MALLVGFSRLAVPVSVAAGAACDVSAMERKSVAITASGTATNQVQISLDPTNPPAAASWVNEGTALTADGTLEISKPCAWIRVNTTAFTSGTPVGYVAGLTSLGS